MDNKKYEVILGCLLHDTGKLKFRYDDGRRHSLSGRDFLIEELEIREEAISDMVFFHHHKDLISNKIDDENVAYISYIADNIASFSDRRESEHLDSGFDPRINLESVFNLLNDNIATGSYEGKTLKDNKPIYPKNEVINLSPKFYGEIINNLRINLKGMERTKDYLQSYLEVLESNLSYVPSSTNKKEVIDISLYDHVKMTAAYGSAIYDYLKENNRENYKKNLLDNRNSFYDEKAFLLVKIDISGIQKFIYNIVKDKALKSLRSRSFYLELLLENIIDELFDQLDYTRANLIYSGGGQAYLLLANTIKIKETIYKLKEEINKWFLEEFGSDLYIAMDYVEASSNNFRNNPEGSYDSLFKDVSDKISNQKFKKYSYEEIIKLNSSMVPKGDRECKICNRTDSLNDENVCSMCQSIIDTSSGIIDKSHFLITSSPRNLKGYKLPLKRWAYPIEENKLRNEIREEKDYVRAYSKNKYYSGKKISSNLWVGDYASTKLLSDLTEDKDGISRIGVLRADVDNLGNAFVKGFKRDGKDRFVSLSRTATLSRMLSMFFKSNINYLLENPEYQIFTNENNSPRKAIIIYSGGDDIFLVGNWLDVVGFSIDLNKALKKFSENSLTISAGIGIFQNGYPISNMAEETGYLESAAKDYVYTIDGQTKQKNAVCLFEKNMIFTWEELEEQVIGEKLNALTQFMKDLNEEDVKSGNSMLYKILDYLRKIEDQINIPRLLYLISRKTPKTDEGKLAQKNFSQNLYQWVKDPKDRKQLEMAIILYVYNNRGEENGI